MSTNTQSQRTRGHRAGVFDIRNVIGALLAIDGLILFLLGLFADTEEHKTGGINANLWTGLALLVAGGIFIAWAWLRPVVVPSDFESDTDEGRPAGH